MLIIIEVKKIIFITSLLYPFWVGAQTISTFAGNGTTGDTGDGGPAIEAAISYTDGCAVDMNGNLYFTTVGYNAIRKVTPCGIISTIAGTGIAGYNGDSIAATTAEINNAGGIAVDKSNNVYVADTHNSRVRKINAITGLITTIAGNGTTGFAGDGGPATAAILYDPEDICFDSKGNLYIADANNHRIRKIDTNGVISTIAGTGPEASTGDGGPAISAELSLVTGICSDKIGNIYLAQTIGTYAVRKIDTAGIITTVAGNGTAGNTGDGGLATVAELTLEEVKCDNLGNLYISTSGGGNSVRLVDTNGIIHTIVGTGVHGFSGDGGAADSSELSTTYGIALDTIGNLYIADKDNKRIRKVTFNSVIIPVVTISSTADTICNGTQVTFTATATGSSAMFTYQWLVNGSPTADTGNIYSYIPANGDSVRCVIFVNGLCATPSSNTITITDSGIVPEIYITNGTTDTICAGSSVTYTAVATGSSAFNYIWYVNGAVTSIAGNTYTYMPVAGDSVYCMLAGSFLCSGAPDTVVSNSLTMVVAPIVTPTIIFTGFTSAVVDSMVTLTAAITGLGGSYIIKWYNNGILFDTTTTDTVTYIKAAGIDHITATAIPISVGSSSSCYDSATSATYTVTANTTGIVNVFALQSLTVYPNPAHDQITITGRDIANLTITNTIGQLLISQDDNKDNVNVNIESLPIGIYLVKITDSQGRKTVSKIVKQ